MRQRQVGYLVASKVFIIYDNHLYSKRPCARCSTGTMTYEQDKAGSPHYWKCLLCGDITTLTPKKLEKVTKKVPENTANESETRSIKRVDTEIKVQ